MRKILFSFSSVFAVTALAQRPPPAEVASKAKIPSNGSVYGSVDMAADGI
jgi:hypothetical protein